MLVFIGNNAFTHLLLHWFRHMRGFSVTNGLVLMLFVRSLYCDNITCISSEQWNCEILEVQYYSAKEWVHMSYYQFNNLLLTGFGVLLPFMRIMKTVEFNVLFYHFLKWSRHQGPLIFGVIILLSQCRMWRLLLEFRKSSSIWCSWMLFLRKTAVSLHSTTDNNKYSRIYSTT